MFKKATDVKSFFTKFNPQFPIILLYGNDQGLISHYAQKFIQFLQTYSKENGTISEIEASSIHQQSNEILNIAYSLPMFSISNILRIKNAGNQVALIQALQELSKNFPKDCYILIEALELKKDSKLRTFIEKSPNAMALPCYHDSHANIIQLAHEICAKYNIHLDRNAEQTLTQLLGSDHMISIQEIEKLCLYVFPKQKIEINDIEEIIQDNTLKNLTLTVDSFLLADKYSFYNSLSRNIAQKLSLQQLCHMIIRQLEQLQNILYKMNKEKLSAIQAIETLKTPIFYKQKDIFYKATKIWSLELLFRTIKKIYETRIIMRQEPSSEEIICKQALLEIISFLHHKYKNNTFN